MYSFTNDDDEGNMTMSEALNRAEASTHTQENDMSDETEVKKPARKTKQAAPAETKPAAPVETKAPARKKKEPVAEAPAETKRGPHVIPDGFIGLAALAEELEMAPALLRRKLRAMEGVEKPEGHGWMWKENSKELTALRKKLTTK